MDEWIQVRNDTHAALVQARARSQELKERFRQIKQRLLHLSIVLSVAEQVKERSLAAYSATPHAERLQDELTQARERVARTRQEMNDLETLMAASKAEFRLLAREIPVMRKAFEHAEQLFWFGLFERLRDRIRAAVGGEVEQAYAAYAASFVRDTGREAFLQRLFTAAGDAEHLSEIRKALAREFPLRADGEKAERPHALAAPSGSNRDELSTPGDEARQWARMVRG